MMDQKALYLYNKKKIQEPYRHDVSVLKYESMWITEELNSTGLSCESMDYSSFLAKFDELIEREASEVPESSKFVSNTMNREQFRCFIQEFAIDGLTEAQVFYYIMPRLHLTAQLPLLRIMIDEFGSANPKRMHTNLFCELLKELELPTEETYYYDRIGLTNYEFLNLYFWLTLRADDPSYFIGALTYLETVIPNVFPCYVEACNRLNISAHHYYSEHCHIDTFHSKECLRVLSAMVNSNTLNPKKAWDGVILSSQITNKVFEHAVEKARKRTLVSVADTPGALA